MPLELSEARVRRIPVGSTLLIRVVPNGDHVNATGRVDKPDDAAENFPHGAIVGGVTHVPLALPGRYISRVTVVLNASTEESVTINYSIENPSDEEIRSWAPEFKGRSAGDDKFIGRAKWIITVTAA
jgi:hypothetical protein